MPQKTIPANLRTFLEIQSNKSTQIWLFGRVRKINPIRTIWWKQRNQPIAATVNWSDSRPIYSNYKAIQIFFSFHKIPRFHRN